jgi:tyrosyl-tRNA synthetase
VTLKDVLIKIGFASSNSDYKRNLKNLAYKINNSAVKNEDEILSNKHINDNIIKISFGKKKHYLIKII